MEREDTTRYISHLQVMEKLSDFYELHLPERIVQEYVYDCLLELGELAIERYFVALPIKDYKIEAKDLPCNMFHIVSVTKLLDADRYVNAQKPYGFRYNYNYVEKPYGVFIDYKANEKGLHFNITGIDVWIEYDGIKTDEAGNILFKEDILNALVAYVIHKHDYVKLRTGQIAPAVYQESYRIMKEEMEKARRPYFNRNYFDKVVKSLYSYNRNRYFY